MSEELYKSGLQQVIVETLQDNVAPIIEKAVNGKVNGLRTELQEYMRKDEIWKAEDKQWKESSEAWRKTADPVRKLYVDGKVVVVFLKWAIATIVGIAGFLYAVQQITNYKIF